MNSIVYFFHLTDQEPQTVCLNISTFEQLCNEISKLFPGLKHYSISYIDDEDDPVTVTCDLEFTEAQSFGLRNGHLLVLNLEPTDEPANSSSESESVPNNQVPNPASFLSSLASRFFELPAGTSYQSFLSNLESRIPEFVSEVVGNKKISSESESEPEPEPELEPELEPEPRMEPELEIEEDFFEESSPEEEEEEEEEEMQQCKPIHNAICDHCDRLIQGIRYKCFKCEDYDLCEVCEELNGDGSFHNPRHFFAKLYNPSQRVPSKKRRRRRRFRCAPVRPRINQLERDVEALRREVSLLQSSQQQEPANEHDGYSLLPSEDPEETQQQQDSDSLEGLLRESSSSMDVHQSTEASVPGEWDEELCRRLGLLNF